jgi:site-specific DNA-methyltransferase (adenine-specific)
MNQLSDVQWVDVALVKPYWRNPRRNEHAAQYVAESIRRYGWTVPMLVDRDMVIIAGHTRYRAAHILGLKQVPVIVVDLLEDKARAYRIIDNRTHELSDWDLELLRQEVEALGGGEFLEYLIPDEMVGKLIPGWLKEQTEEAEKALIADQAVAEARCPYCGHINRVEVQDVGPGAKAGTRRSK